MTEEMMATEAKSNGSSSKDQGGNGKKYTRFPRCAISAVLDFPEGISREGYDVKRDRLCLMIDRKTSSSTTAAALAAARAYGLIKDGTDGYVGITDLGRRALAGDAPTRMAAFAEALSNVDEYRRFLDKYADGKVPSEGVAEDYLRDAMGLNPQEAKTFYKVVMANVREAGLVEALPGGEYIRKTSLEATPELADFDEDGKKPLPGAPRPPDPIVPPLTPRRGVEMHFNIQVHLPESTDPNVYDAIFRSMKDNLMGS